MRRTIEIFLTKGESSARMISDIVMLLKLLPLDKRPLVRIRVFDINSLGESPVLRRMLESNKVRYFPTIISDGVKLIEGYYPSLDELERIILRESR